MLVCRQASMQRQHDHIGRDSRDFSRLSAFWAACTEEPTLIRRLCLQLIWLCMLEVPAYALNQYLVLNVAKGIDAGGSICIHAFGAYYGLAASYYFSFPSSGRSHPKNGASYTSDVFAMLASM